MRKLVGLMAAVAAVSSVAGAQTWQGQNGTYKFDGCEKDGQSIFCGFTYTLTRSETSSLRWDGDDVTYYMSNGTSGKSKRVSLAGSDWTGYWALGTAIKGVPVAVWFDMGLPSNTASIRALVLDGYRLDNVPVKGNTPAPAATTAPANTNAYNAVMTNCKPGANGTLTCTATLTPRR